MNIISNFLFSLVFVSFGHCCHPGASYCAWNKQTLVHVCRMKGGKKTCFFFVFFFFFSSTRHFLIALLKASEGCNCALLIVNTNIFKLNYLLRIHCAQGYVCSLGCQGVGRWIPVSSWSRASWIQIWALSLGFLGSRFGSPTFSLSDLRRVTEPGCFIPCVCKVRGIVPIS